MQIFYTPDIVPGQLEYALSEEESRHCVKVLRFAEGTPVQLVDGKGSLYHAAVKRPDPKKTLLQINSIKQAFNNRNHFLHIAVAPTKNPDRIEWFLEKATEIGIDEISFIICKRSERREVKTDRLNKVITAAMKQSLKAYHPVLNSPVNFPDFVTKRFEGQRYIAHCLETNKAVITEDFRKNNRYEVMIGPEGDFSGDEIEMALEYGFKPITLGNTRLRTETAALEACFEINFLNR